MWPSDWPDEKAADLDLHCFQSRTFLLELMIYVPVNEECSGSMVECLTRDREVVGSRLT